MALVLPTLRLWVLLLNVYSTFKAMKTPPKSQRSARNKSGPSARAMQLRKRELKSCMAVWIVWSLFSTSEGVLDSTLGLVTPFYNELKCFILLFLLLTRAHGAEAIFLHVIHPLLRPYTPAIDDMLANVHSVIDLFLLLLSLPFEYISYWWHRWRRGKEADPDENRPPSCHEGGGEPLPEEKRVLRPRSASQHARLSEANKRARTILQDIDDTRYRVRASARNQPPRGGRGTELGPPGIGLRTRRVLEHPPAEGQIRGPGSGTTGVHHIYSAALNELPPAPSLQPFPVLPTAPTTNPTALSHPPQVSAYPSSHEIWPPRAAFEEDGRAPPRRTPPPPYPSIPSTHPSTSRLSDPLPPSPRIIEPPDLVMPTPRRVSTSTSSSRHAFKGADRFPGQTDQLRPSRSARSAEPQEVDKNGSVQSENFFGQALEPSIQVVKMDTDTETLSTRDASSADEKDNQAKDGGFKSKLADTNGGEIGGKRRGRSEVEKGKRKASAPAGPLRRTTRRRLDKSLDVKTDEFGFTIRPGSHTYGSVSTSNAQTMSPPTGDPSKKKPLARTKPTLKEDPGSEAESSDGERRKKRQRLDRVDASEATEDNKTPIQKELESMSSPGNGGIRRRGKRKARVQKTEEPHAPKIPKHSITTHDRITRASKQPVTARDERPQPSGVTGRMRGTGR